MMETTSKIYVAGHRGLVGSAIVRQLREQGYDNLVTRTHAELDLCDQESVAAFFEAERPEYVFLAAARVGGILENSRYPAEFITDNILMQTHVIQHSHLSGVKRLLFLGSSCIYPKHAPQPMQEDHLLTGPLEPTNSAYAIAKIAGVEMCRSYREQYGSCFVPVMPTNVYGPGDNYDLHSSHVVPALIRKCHLARFAKAGDWDAIARDEQVYGTIPEELKHELGLVRGSGVDPVLRIWGTGKPLREFLFVNDLADGCLFVMNQPECLDLINIGSGMELTIRETAQAVREAVGFDGPIKAQQDALDGTPRKLLDTSQLARLGWQAKTTFAAGLKQTSDAYVAQLCLAN